jgi:hypothetical protein
MSGLLLTKSQRKYLAPLQAPFACPTFSFGTFSAEIAHMTRHVPFPSDFLRFQSRKWFHLRYDLNSAALPLAALNKGGLLERLAESERQGPVTLLGVYSHSILAMRELLPRQQ